ncbi:MAG: efflux RND transporter periplasmic adaptor subunit [Deltaproteobacteria bacterium]|nr:efflux RND transporter periplasmic adaptor subunit [Deltaproteobacteria bacterium]
MSYSLFSESWYRVAELKPRLRSHARIHHHVYRGRDWYVLQDHSTGTYHRFSNEAYYIIGLMDGSNTLQEIWKTACENLGDDMPTQDEVINLLSQLHQVDMLQSDIPPDIADLYKRHLRYKKNSMINRIRSPLSVSIPLLDPEKFLSKTVFLTRPVFSKIGITMYCIILLSAIYLAMVHWSELTGNLADRVLALENVFLLWLVYPVIKIFHEFSHAYTIKHWGGEVHEMGVMFLVFVPIPYVEASSSIAFKERYKRVMVGGAGIMAELLLAALAVLVWVNVEPGIVRAVSFNVIIIAGVSTLLFNGNPLLRFDAYYILSDLIEIPNLAMRANKYIGYILQRYLLNAEDVQSPVTARGEAPWFLFYGMASFVYRMFIMVRIAVFVAGKFFIIGIAFALWGLAGMLIMPLVKIFKFLFTDPSMQHKKARVAAVTGFSLLFLVLCLFIIPLPSFTVAEGVLWAPDSSRLHAGTNGFIKEILVTPGKEVQKGTPLIRCENPELITEKKELESSLEEYELRLELARTRDRTETKILQDEIERIESGLKDLADKLDSLLIRSPHDGIFLLPEYENLHGQYFIRGAQLGYVVDFDKVTAMIVVTQEDIDRVRTETEDVEAKLAENIKETYHAYVKREVPAASPELPSLALSLEGGGELALDPKTKEKLKAFENLFHFEIVIESRHLSSIGERVFVRFYHGHEPLFSKGYRAVRRVLLSKFSV